MKRRLMVALFALLLGACNDQSTSNPERVQSGSGGSQAGDLLVRCADLRNNNDQPLGDFFIGFDFTLYLEWRRDDSPENADIFDRFEETIWPGLVEVRFYRVEAYGRPAIRVDRYNVDYGLVTRSDVFFPYRSPPHVVAIEFFRLTPLNSMGQWGPTLFSDRRSERQLPPEIEAELLERYNIGREWSEEEIRNMHIRSMDPMHFVGECEFYDDLSWVE